MKARNILMGCWTLLVCTLHMSCIREDKYTNDPEGNLTALWQLIDHNYCFLDYKAEAYGLDWNQVYSKYHQQLNPGMNQDQLFEVCCNMLSELRDGHVNLYSAGDVGRYWKWHEDYPANFDARIQEIYLGHDYKIASGLKYKILEDNIGYIYYESFAHGIGEGNLDEVMDYLKSCHGLILDIRNNGGGNLTYATQLAARFTNKTLHVGYICHKTGPGHHDFSKPEAEYIQPSHGIRWQKKAVVLTNRKCYSSANTFIRNIKECPLVTVMGDKTGGGSGMPFTSEMPNGWLVRFSACPMLDAQMQHIEFGIDPDIPVCMKQEDIIKNKDTMIETARIFLKK